MIGTMIMAAPKNLLVLFGSLAVVFLSSCDRSQPEASDRRKQITYAASLLPDEVPAYRAILNRYEEKSGVKVRLIPQQYNDIRRSVQAENKAGKGQLDLVEMDVFYLHATRTLMRPLDFEPSVLARLTPDALEAGLFSNERLFVPHRLNWQALIYNSQKIKNPPEDWEALLELVRAHPGRMGFKASAYEGLTCDVLPYLWQAGGDFLHPNSQAGRQALDFIAELSSHMNPACRRYKEGTILSALEQDEILLHANWPFVVPQLKGKGLMPSKFRTAPLPRGPAGKATVLGGGYLAIPATASNPQAALDLVSFLISAETQKMLVRDLGWFPVRPEGWESLSEEDRSLLEGFIAMQDYVKARPHLPEYEEISIVWQEGVRDILFQDKTVRTAAKEMQEKIERILESSKSQTFIHRLHRFSPIHS